MPKKKATKTSFCPGRQTDEPVRPFTTIYGRFLAEPASFLEQMHAKAALPPARPASAAGRRAYG
ncbi:hypothetical protein Defa_08830 [Desulfovibrio sp. TH_2024_36128]|uniref:Uncharacterized protein n=1 Tax=Desulfovibrio falkowii TaxID=3136602 RepID=A0ABQ0E6N9_9BACT